MEIHNDPSIILPGDLGNAIEKAKNELLIMHGDAQRLTKLRAQMEKDIVDKSGEIDSLTAQIDSLRSVAKEANAKAEEAKKQEADAVKKLSDLQVSATALLYDINELKDKKEKVEQILK